jgi:DNA-binding GntR family transcriptional regulator
MVAESRRGRRSLTLQQRVYEQIREEILTGDIPPGQQLREVHVARRFGTSQAPVREALRRICDEGLATSFPYRGTFAKQLSWAEVVDIYSLREELEAWAIRRLLSRSRIDLAPIKRAFRDLERVVKTGEPRAALNADLAFHETICAAAGSDLLLETWGSVVTRFRGLRAVLARHSTDDFSTLVPAHRTILDALDTRDTQLAETAIREHLRRALREREEQYKAYPDLLTPTTPSTDRKR